MDHSYGFEAYDARVMFRSNDAEFLQMAVSVARKALLGQVKTHGGPYDAAFEFETTDNGYEMQRNGEHLSSGDNIELFFGYLDDIIRITVAEFSKKMVFLHAGAVAWDGKGLILPAMSHRGKSSLVLELVRAGAQYYSDDFAILDRRGRLNPFARPISMRSRDGGSMNYEIDAKEELGASIGVSAVEVGLIALTEYKSHARWRPRILSTGEGVLATLPFAIPLQRDPAKCLRVLNLVGSHATLIETPRGDAKRAAMQLIDFLNKLSASDPSRPCP